jgi:hypothetical protein
MFPESAMKKTFQFWSTFILIAIVAMSCSKNGSPTSPSGKGPDLPNATGSVQVSINPNPVPFSGTPVTDTPGCATLKNTWYYDQVFTETAGAAVTLTSRIDFFDGFSVNNIQGIAINIPAKGTAALKARWCSGNATSHTAQSTFSGVDSHGAAITVNTPVVKLMAP